MIYAPEPAIRALWPVPALGDWEKRDLQKPLPVPGGSGLTFPINNLAQRLAVGGSELATGIGDPVDPSLSAGTTNFPARRGVADRGTYAEQTYNNPVPHLVTHSLARETLYNWADAQFNVGGGAGYPYDYGFGPGAHYDATVEMGNVQMYMKPGIYIASPGAKATPGKGSTSPTTVGGSNLG